MQSKNQFQAELDNFFPFLILLYFALPLTFCLYSIVLLPGDVLHYQGSHRHRTTPLSKIRLWSVF